jgi:excinuclease ABC subunit A
MGGGPLKRRPGTGIAPAEPIRLTGVRVHNLRSIDVEIPRNRLTVITGVSGSGKSSLAFDTLYAEGRRRYVECLSTYMQQFLERMARPALESASGLPPAVAIERGVPAAQARSTVGTTTEVSDYLRLLFARVGHTHCTNCGEPVVEEAPGRVAAELIDAGGKGMVDFEIDPPGSIERWKAVQRELERDGFLRIVREGKAVRAQEADYVDGPIEVVADRLAFEPSRRARLAESVETAYRFGHERCTVRWSNGRVRRFSRRLHCPDCDLEYRRPEPRMFSPNSPLGACPECQGFGRSIRPDLDRILPDRSRTLKEGPVDPWNKPSYKGCYEDLKKSGKRYGLRWDVPYAELPEEHRRLIEDGEDSDDGFYGIRGFFDWLEGRTYKVHVRVFLARYRAYDVCGSCDGSKLRP